MTSHVFNRQRHLTVPDALMDVLIRYLDIDPFEEDVKAISKALSKYCETSEGQKVKIRELTKENEKIKEEERNALRGADGRVSQKDTEILAVVEGVAQVRDKILNLEDINARLHQLSSVPTPEEITDQTKYMANLGRQISELETGMATLQSENERQVRTIWGMLHFHICFPTNPAIDQYISEEYVVSRMLPLHGLSKPRVLYWYTRDTIVFTDIFDKKSFTWQWTPKLTGAGILAIFLEIDRDVSQSIIGRHLSWLCTLLPSLYKLRRGYEVSVLIAYLEKVISLKDGLKCLNAALLMSVVAALAGLEASCGTLLGHLLLTKIKERNDNRSYPFLKWTIIEKLTLAILLSAASANADEWLNVLPKMAEIVHEFDIQIKEDAKCMPELIQNMGHLIDRTDGRILRTQASSPTKEETKLVLLKDAANGIQYIWVFIKGQWHFMEGNIEFKDMENNVHVRPRGLVAMGYSKIWFLVGSNYAEIGSEFLDYVRSDKTLYAAFTKCYEMLE